MKSLNFEHIEEMDEKNKLSLRSRKEKVKAELKKNNLTTIQLSFLLGLDNLNEDLIYNYIVSLDKDAYKEEINAISNESKIITSIPQTEPQDDVDHAIRDYSNYISVTKLQKIKQKIFGKANKGYRNISFKALFFNILLDLKQEKTNNLKINLGKLNVAIKARKRNNQPFDIDNFEAFYFFLCTLLSSQIQKNKNKKDKYFKDLKTFISKIKEIDEYAKSIDYELEKKDIKKFFRIIFAILNLDTDNYEDISQVAMILNAPSVQEKYEMISFAYKKIESKFDTERAKDFIKKIGEKDNFFSLDFKVVENEIELSEECYLYDYIIKNNVFKKYEKQIKDLLNTIYNSDLIKQLLRAVYGEDYKKLEPIFEKEYSINDFWDNIILFVPFKVERISGFSYRDIFKIFISLYKFNHFKTNIENEIFTLGAFVRTLAHESLGHFLFSYIFFMFYANSENKDEYYISPRMNVKIKNLDKKNYIELVGNTLAKIELDILNNDTNKIKEKEDNNNIVRDDYEILKNKLFEEFKKIIGDEYAKILSQKLIERKKNEIEIKENNKIQDKSFNNSENIDLEKKKIILRKSKEIIDILFQCISEDFDKIIRDLELRQEAYKSKESGNLIEVLLFNDFSQYMTFKECLFLLNEENYKNTNLFKFRTEFKNIAEKKNEEFLKDLIKGGKIFGELFSQYYTIYENSNSTKKDFITLKTFREDMNNNLVKKCKTFNCCNIKIDDSILPDEPDF